MGVRVGSFFLNLPYALLTALAWSLVAFVVGRIVKRHATIDVFWGAGFLAVYLECLSVSHQLSSSSTSPWWPDGAATRFLVLAAVAGDSLQPGDCVAIEDSRWGLESARQAGLRTIAVTHTYTLAELGAADLVLDSLEALDVASLSRQLA